MVDIVGKMPRKTSEELQADMEPHAKPSRALKSIRKRTAYTCSKT